MSNIAESMMRKGYIPLRGDSFAAIGWQSVYLKDFWMWNRKFIEYEGGVKHVRTVKVTELKDAALHYWRDRWVPLKPLSEGFLRTMERALREHAGLRKEGIRFPDKPFLEMPEPIAEELLGPDVREYLGLEKDEKKGLVPSKKVPEGVLDAYRMEKSKNRQIS